MKEMIRKLGKSNTVIPNIIAEYPASIVLEFKSLEKLQSWASTVGGKCEVNFC